MIVRLSDSTARLIRQPDHAALAGGLMSEWEAGGLPAHPRRRSILLAVAEHDNGWREPDASPMIDADGHLLDFVSAPVAERQAVWPRGVGRLADDPWAAALVARHALWIYDRFRAEDEWRPFFETMARLRDLHLRASGLAEAELEHDYQFVRLGDLLSLTFCAGWTEEQRYGSFRIRRQDDTLLVDPDPFGARTIPIEVPAREMPAGPYAGPEAVREAWRGATLVPVTGAARGA